jgi:predicted PurR-regulated permease PerM
MALPTRFPLAALVAPILLLLVLWFAYSVAGILLLFFVSVLFSLYLTAIAEGLQRYLGMPRAVGLIVSLVLTLIGVLLTFYMMVPPVVEQFRGLVETLPVLIESWDRQLQEWSERSAVGAQLLGERPPGHSYVAGWVAQIAGYFQDVVPYLFSGVRVVIHFISVMVMGVYMAAKPALYREGFIQLAPPLHRELVRDILTDLSRTLRAWIVGQLIGMLVLGVLTWIGLELLGVPYAMAFGVFAAAVAIVPFFGTLLAVVLPTLFVLGTGSVGHALVVAAFGLAVNLFESNILQPMIMERQVKLPPVLSVLAVLIMARLLHIVGIFVAVPVLAVVMVIVRRVYVHRILEGRGFRRALRDRPVEIRLPGEGSVLVHPSGKERTIPAILESGGRTPHMLEPDSANDGEAQRATD